MTTDRVQIANIIRSIPRYYKVCECCDSIVHRRFAVCQSCSGYRFDASPASVVACVDRIESDSERGQDAEDAYDGAD